MLGKFFKVVKDISGNCLIFIVFGNAEVVFFVDFFDFDATGEFVVIFVELDVDEAFFVVFVFEVAEYFFDEVFEGNEPRRAAKLVDDDSDAFLFGHHTAHHLVGEHRFGSKFDGTDMFFPVVFGVE